MTNKSIVLILFSLFFQFSFAQEVVFEYSQKESRKAVTINYIQYFCENKSISKVKDIKDITQIENYKNFSFGNTNDSIVSYIHNESDNLRFVRIQLTQIFKDYNAEETFLSSPDNIKQNHKIIKDSLDIFKWEILNDKDTIIMNFNCKKAKAKFRGRDYLAYFSSDIANNGGPWKFDGLPGFILKVNSMDGFLNIEPISIKINSTASIKIENPYKNKKYILFSELKSVILKEEREQYKSSKSLNPYLSAYTIPSGFKTIEDIGLNYERRYE
jgi:GLPGLI family protein